MKYLIQLWINYLTRIMDQLFHLQTTFLHIVTMHVIAKRRNACSSRLGICISNQLDALALSRRASQRGDVPGWVLVVLMTAGLVTGIWTIAAPRLNLILRNSLDSMNSIR